MAQTQTTRRNRLNPKRRQAKKNRIQQEWITIANSDWPTQQPIHCEDCHLQYEGFEGEIHWGCVKYPGLNKDTCPTCSPNPIYPQDAYPLIVVAANPTFAPLNFVVKEVRDFYLNFDYLSPWKKSLFNFFLSFVAFLLARKL